MEPAGCPPPSRPLISRRGGLLGSIIALLGGGGEGGLGGRLGEPQDLRSSPAAGRWRRGTLRVTRLPGILPLCRPLLAKHDFSGDELREGSSGDVRGVAAIWGGKGGLRVCAAALSAAGGTGLLHTSRGGGSKWLHGGRGGPIATTVAIAGGQLYACRRGGRGDRCA